MSKIGDNIKLTGEERWLHFSSFCNPLLKKMIEKKQIEADISALKKQAKAEDPTFTAQKFDHYAKMFFGEDDQKPVDRLKSDRENLEWGGLIPATSNGDLLSQIDRVDKERMIWLAGYQKGSLDFDKVSGYDAGSVDDKTWREGFEVGKMDRETKVPDILKRIRAEANKEDPPEDDPFADAAE